MARVHPSGLELNLHQPKAQDPEIMAEAVPGRFSHLPSDFSSHKGWWQHLNKLD
jgi:hypothetical protein